MTNSEAAKILTEKLEGYGDSIQYEMEHGDDREWLHELEENAEAIRMALRALEREGWIPVTERLPEDGFYLCTLDGELCGDSEPFTGTCGFEKGVWDESDMVLAWMPLPEPYGGDTE